MAARSRASITLLVSCMLGCAGSSFASSKTDAEVQARLRSCNAALVRSAADEILRDPKTLREPLMLLFAASGRRTVGDKEEAAFLYLAGRLRSTRQLVFERGDAAQVIPMIGGFVGSQVMPVIEADPELARRVVDRVVAWDRVTADPFRDRREGAAVDLQKKLADIDAVLVRLPEQIASDPERVAKARVADRQRDSQIESIRAEQCGPGKLDSTDIEAAKKLIKESGIRLVTTHPLVLSHAGTAIASASVASSQTSSGETLPNRLSISLKPEVGNLFYAEVDVKATVTSDRKLGTVTTSLACITKLWIGKRDSSWKDVCTGDPAALKPD